MLDQCLSTMWVGGAYWGARRRKFSSRAALQQWQDRRVQSHLRFVLRHSEYYRSTYQGHDLADWRSLPISDKTAMMANFQAFNTLGISRDQALAVARKAEQTRDFRPMLEGVTVGLSSGTSGSYSLFLSSAAENAAFIGTALARLLRGSLVAEHRIALFHRAHSNLYQGLDSGRMKHRFYDLGEDLETQFESLSDLSPTQIIGPPILLRRLGEAVRSGRVTLAPRAVLSVAEVLDDADRAAIQQDFGLRIDEAYIATEGFLAATCTHGSLHVNEDCLVMQREWVDRNSGRFTPVITDFRRRVQPMIRYQLDDVLVDGKSPCPCGSVFAVLERVEGRCDDVLLVRSADGSSIRRVFPDFVRRAVCAACDDVSEYRVSQESMDQMVVRLEVHGGRFGQAQLAVQSSLVAAFRRLDCEVPRMEFVDGIDIDPTKKLRRVTRSYKTDLT